MASSPETKRHWRKLPTIHTSEHTKDRLAEQFGINLIVEGRDHLSVLLDENDQVKDQGAIFSAFPHNGHPDGLMLRLALPENLRDKLILLVKSGHFGRLHVLRNFISLFANTFPISGDSMGGFIGAIRLIEDKNAYLGIFAEGTRDNYGKPLEDRHFEEGLAYMLLKADDDTPLFLTNLQGAEDLWPKHQKLPSVLAARKTTVTVTFSEPLYRKQLFDADLFDPGARKRMGTQKYKELRDSELARVTQLLHDKHVAMGTLSDSYSSSSTL
jgi:1-acyl-sn-glycerol-3-phosphate acyltransferase